MKTSTKTITIDGGMMSDRRAVHDHLTARLALPEYYGRNLDALHDCLTEIGSPTLLILRRPDALRECLGSYADALIRALRVAAAENPCLSLTVEGEDDLQGS